MILTVTLNAAIDRTVAVPNFRLGRRHRAVESRTVAGGKGINVARALSLLGRPVIATGFVGGPTGTRVLEGLREESVLTDFTRIAAETRINLAVIDPTSGEQTEINERGPAVSPEETKRLFERIGYLASGARICVLAGSLPPGAGDDLYARLIADLGRRGVAVVLDAEGEAMLAGVRAGASMVTPNEREAEELVGQEFDGGGDLAQGLQELVRLGAVEAAITRPEGCVAAVGEGSERRLLEIHTEPLEAVSTVGSGDAFLAGYVAARYEGRSPEDCLAYGVACGAESTQHFGAGTRRPQPGRAPARRGRRARFGGPGGSVGWLFNASPGGITWKSKSAVARKGGAHTGSTMSQSSPRAAPVTPTTSTSAGPSVLIASNCRWSLRRWTGWSAPTPPSWSTSWAASACSTWRGSGPASRTPRSAWSRSPPRPSTWRPG